MNSGKKNANPTKLCQSRNCPEEQFTKLVGDLHRQIVVRQRSWLFVLGPAGCHPYRGYPRRTEQEIMSSTRNRVNNRTAFSRSAQHCAARGEGPDRGAPFLSSFYYCSRIDWDGASRKIGAGGSTERLILELKGGYKVLSEDGKKNLGGPENEGRSTEAPPPGGILQASQVRICGNSRNCVPNCEDPKETRHLRGSLQFPHIP